MRFFYLICKYTYFSFFCKINNPDKINFNSVFKIDYKFYFEITQDNVKTISISCNPSFIINYSFFFFFFWSNRVALLAAFLTAHPSVEIFMQLQSSEDASVNNASRRFRASPKSFSYSPEQKGVTHKKPSEPGKGIAIRGGPRNAETSRTRISGYSHMRARIIQTHAGCMNL